MEQIIDHDEALAVLTHPEFMVPPVQPASTGVGWLRSAVARFSSGAAHQRRHQLVVDILTAIPPTTLLASAGQHPVALLGRALGADDSILGLVRDAAQAYLPGTGDETRADLAVDRLVAVFGGTFDEPTAARISVLVQACAATEVLINRARHRPVADVLRDDPPVKTTKRQALTTTMIGNGTIEAGRVVHVRLAGDLAFGAGPHRCPGRAHALALAGVAPDVELDVAPDGATS